MSEILDGLLRLSRAEAIEPSHAGTVNLSELVRQRFDHFATLAEARQIELRHEADQETLVAADTGDVEAVLDNLLDNAVKYTPPGGIVCVSVRTEEEEVVLTVADSGVGFDKAERAHLFDRFYRSDKPAVQQARGSGLGLPIVKAIVEGYGGGVEAHSEGPGQGSAFSVRLPRMRATR